MNKLGELGIKSNNVLYMVVTADKLELPMMVGTPQEVADTLGLSVGCVYARVSKGDAGKKHNYKIVGVKV